MLYAFHDYLILFVSTMNAFLKSLLIIHNTYIFIYAMILLCYKEFFRLHFNYFEKKNLILVNLIKNDFKKLWNYTSFVYIHIMYIETSQVFVHTLILTFN